MERSTETARQATDDGSPGPVHGRPDEASGRARAGEAPERGRAVEPPAPGEGEAAAGVRREPPAIVRRLQARREAYREHGLVYRIAWITAGFIVLAAGVVMMIAPGPALVVIPIGLAMLSLEFAWAQRLLETALERGVEAKERAAGASRRARIVGAAASVCAIAAAVAVWLIYFA